jgi:hypothetical protein
MPDRHSLVSHADTLRESLGCHANQCIAFQRVVSLAKLVAVKLSPEGLRGDAAGSLKRLATGGPGPNRPNHRRPRPGSGSS